MWHLSKTQEVIALSTSQWHIILDSVVTAETAELRFLMLNYFNLRSKCMSKSKDTKKETKKKGKTLKEKRAAKKEKRDKK